MYINCVVQDNRTGLKAATNIEIVKFYIKKYGIEKLDTVYNESKYRLVVQEVDIYDDITVIKSFFFKPEEWINRNRLLNKFEADEMVIIIDKNGDNYVEA